MAVREQIVVLAYNQRFDLDRIKKADIVFQQTVDGHLFMVKSRWETPRYKLNLSGGNPEPEEVGKQ